MLNTFFTGGILVFIELETRNEFLRKSLASLRSGRERVVVKGFSREIIERNVLIFRDSIGNSEDLAQC